MLTLRDGIVPVFNAAALHDDTPHAEKLARLYRSAELTPVWVPDAAHEALRDVVRAREAAKKDQLARARNRASE